MKILVLFLGVLLTSISMNAQQSINGIWNTGQDNTKIKIDNTIGKIHSSDNAKATVGKLIIKDLNKVGNSYKGKLYLIRRNLWADAVFVPNGKLLNVTISAGFQKKTVVWNLVN
jgi:hypothetical protein